MTNNLMHLNSEEMQKNLISIIKEKSFQKGATIKLASGKSSSHYFNMKPTMLDPEGSVLIANLMLDAVKSFGKNFDAIGGVELGAVPIASFIAPISQLRGEPIKAYMIRKKPKDHGTASLVEGLTKDETLDGQNIVIVEDVTTTGGSALKAIAACRKEGANIEHIITIVDREEGATDAFNKEGIQLTSLFSASDFL